MRPTFQLLVAITAFVAVSAASAQIFKWVDEHGVTNYSNQRPADRQTSPQVEVVASNISVYTPDPSLLKAVEAFRMQNHQIGLNAAAARASPANPYTVPVYVPAPVASDPCADDRAAHCDEFYTGYYPYLPVVAHRAYRGRHNRIPRIWHRRGAVAEQVVGMDGYIKGNAAGAGRFGHAPSRSLSRRAIEPRRSRGSSMQLPPQFR
jgi:hypothetical protein